MTLIRPFVAWLPVVLMTVLGTLYLANCVQASLAPGKPFEFKYQGSNGPVVVQAESYAVDPLSRSISLSNVSVRSAGSSEDVSAKRVLVRQDRTVFDVKAFQAKAKVVRGKDGLFSALSLLPPEKKGAESPAVRVAIDAIDLVYIDEEQTPTIRQLVRATDLVVDSSASGAIGTTRADIVGAGELAVRLELAKSGEVRFQVNSPGIDLVRLVPVVRGFLTTQQRDQLRPYVADSARFSGEAFGEIPLKGEPVLAAQGSLVARSVSVPDWLAGADVSAEFNYADKMLKLDATSLEPGRKVNFDGGVDLSQGLRVVGGFQAELRDQTRLWPLLAKAVPSELKYSNATYQGIVDLQGEAYKVSGRLSASGAAWDKVRVASLNADLAIDQSRIVARIDRTTYDGYPLSAWADINLKSGELSGAVDGLSDNLTPVLSSFGLTDWAIRGTPNVIFSGTLKSPQAVGGFSGFVTYRQPGGQAYDLGFADLRASFKDGRISVDRGLIAGQYGTARIDGEVRNFGQQLALSAEVGDLTLRTFDDRLSGIAFFKGKIEGSLDSPHVRGQLAAFDSGFETYKFPHGEASIDYSDGVVSLDQVQVALGLGKITGSGTYTLADQNLFFSGQAQEVFASDYTELPIFGRINVEAFSVSGTLDNLSAEFVAQSENLLAYDVAVESTSIKGTWENGKVKVQRVLASIGEGDIDAKGELDPAAGTGQLSGTYQNVSLTALPVDRGALDVQGQVTGKFDYQKLSSEPATGQITGEISALAVNSFEVGPGEFAAQINGDRVTFHSTAGSPQGYLEIENGIVDLADQSYSGRLIASGLSVPDLYRSIEDELTSLSDRDRQALSTLQGSLTFEATASGKKDQLQVSAEYFEASGLELNGEDLGTLKIVAEASADRIEVSSLVWQVADGTITGSGSWASKGDLTGKLNLDHVEAGIVRSYFPDLPNWSAVVDSELDISGTAESPLVSGDLKISQVKDSKDTEIPLTFDNGAFSFRDNGAHLTGRVHYEDISGALVVDAPLAAFEENPGSTATVELLVDTVTLDRASKFLVGLDLSVSRGVIGGNIRLEGNSEQFALSGALSLRPDDKGESRLKPKDSDTGLNDVSVIATGRGQAVDLSIQAFSDFGGLVNGNATLDLSPAIQSLQQGRELSPVTIQGKIAMDEFRVKQKIKLQGPLKTVQADRSSEGTLYGEVNFSGDITEPNISGNIEANGLIINLPSEFPESAASEPGQFQPTFDNLNIVAAKNSRVNLAIGNLDMSGTATVVGPLSTVVLRAPLQIDGGTFNLPSGRVKLEEGGSVNVSLGEAIGGARIEVNMRGKTRVTVRQSDTRYQNYELTLDMRGNLLEPDGVVLTGESDPPDLSQERIKAIVGQQDLIESLASSVLGQGNRGALTEGVYSLAVPTLTQGFTDNIAKALNLDYLVLDYNPFDLATVRAGLTLGKGVTLEASRQLTATDFSIPKYEILLTYRIPSKNPLLSRTRFFIGTDYQVPWKIGLNYSFRF